MPLAGAQETASADCCCGGVFVLVNSNRERWPKWRFSEACKDFRFLTPSLPSQPLWQDLHELQTKGRWLFVVGLWEERKRRKELGLPELEARCSFLLQCVAIKDGPFCYAHFFGLPRPLLKKRRKQENKKGHGHYWGNVGEAYLHTTQSNLRLYLGQDGGEIGGHSRSKEKGTRFLGCFAFILLNLDFSCHTSCWSTGTTAKQAICASELVAICPWRTLCVSLSQKNPAAISGCKVALGFFGDFSGRYRNICSGLTTHFWCFLPSWGCLHFFQCPEYVRPWPQSIQHSLVQSASRHV